MGTIKLAILSLAIVLFTACGSDSSSEEVVQEVNLQVELKAKEFFVIEDNVQTKNMYKMIFDENLSSWDIEIYDGSYSSTPSNIVTNTIAVTTDTLTQTNGLVYKRTNENSEDINLIATANPLIVLKMFDTADEAEEYYNISLIETLKAKEYFVIQNDLEKRSLYKISVDENATQWDITVYDSQYNEENISNLSAGMTIDVGDSNLTDSGGASFWLSTVEEDSFKLVAYGNSLVTLDFYENSEDALAYYNSIDLRAELSAKTFYVIENNSTDKKLVKLIFNDALTSYDFETYSQDYNETSVSSGSNILTVTENKVYFANTSPFNMITNNDDYIELESLVDSLLTYRLYNSSELAKNYFSE